MTTLELMSLLVALMLPAFPAQAESRQPTERVGEEYEVIRSYETNQQSSSGSTGSSNGRTVIRERVLAVRENELELEYDHSKEITAAERARDWQLPARVLKSTDGQVRLLNENELKKRVDSWLQAAKLPRKVCGSWYFTWNAFRVECDPRTVLKLVEELDLTSVDLRDGAAYRDDQASEPALLRREAGTDHRVVYKSVNKIDPNVVRRARAEMDVVTGEIMREPVTLEAALSKRSKEVVSGTISVTFEVDASGQPLRRIKVTEVETRESDGSFDRQTSKETVERRLVQAVGSQDAPSPLPRL